MFQGRFLAVSMPLTPASWVSVAWVSVAWVSVAWVSVACLKACLTFCSSSGQHITSTAVMARALAVLRVYNWAFSAP